MKYNLKYIKAVLYVAATSYALAFFTYLNKLIRNESNNIYMTLAYILLLVSFGILTYATFKHAIYNNKDEDISPTHNITSRPGIFGYSILSLYFMLALLLPFGLYFNYYYVFALLGYTLLGFGEIAGVYLLCIFYICSIITTFYYVHTKHIDIDIFALLSKIGLIIYFGTYGYISFTKNYIK